MMNETTPCLRCNVPVEALATHRGAECRRFAAMRDAGCLMAGLIVRATVREPLAEKTAAQWKAASDGFYERA